MKSRGMKIAALVLCAALIFGTARATVCALAADGAEPSKTKEKIENVGAAADAEASGDETVYILTGADGAVQKIIVSAASADGQSNMTYLETDKDSEINCQGETDQMLPIEMTVSYRLNGKPVSPDALAGKSGRVTIRFDYVNREYEYVEINGTKEKIYVPFAMLTGVLLDNEVFSNVEISNGKLINDGDRIAAVGIAFPGLQENLAVDMDIPEYVEITADVTGFKLGMTVTLAANGLFQSCDTGELDAVTDLNDALGQLTDAMDRLMDGSSQLYDGLSTLLDQSGELVEGIEKLAAGAETLRDGAAALDGGASQLQTGAAQLYDGLNTLASNNNALNSGAAQVFETLLSSANTQLAAAGMSVPTMTVSNYAEVLNGVIASLDSSAVYEQALSTVTAAVEGQRGYIAEQVAAAVQAEVTAQVTAAVQEQIRAQVTAGIRENVAAQVIAAATGMDLERYQAAVAAGTVDEETQAAVEAAIETQMQSGDVVEMIEENTSAQMASETAQAAITANVEEQMASDAIRELIASNTEQQVQKAVSENMASGAVQSQLAAASEGVQSVLALKASLDSYNSFYLGLQSYTAGVAQAVSGAGDLKAGADSLKNGAGQLSAGASGLCSGILVLEEGAPDLVDGIAQLRNGAMQLSDGLEEFNEKGVQKLTETTGEDLDGLIARIRATVDASKNYKTFSGDHSDGQVRFVYRTEAIEAE